MYLPLSLLSANLQGSSTASLLIRGDSVHTSDAATSVGQPISTDDVCTWKYNRINTPVRCIICVAVGCVHRYVLVSGVAITVRVCKSMYSTRSAITSYQWHMTSMIEHHTEIDHSEQGADLKAQLHRKTSIFCILSELILTDYRQ